MDSLRFGLGSVDSPYEHSNEKSGTTKVRGIIRHLSHYQPYNNDSLPWKLSKSNDALRELELA